MRSILILVMLVVSAPANAGMFNIIDNMFTFREDQRERVAPKRRMPAKQVVTPNFDERINARWSNYYSRPDLKPVDYTNASSSKVMRPYGQTDAGGYAKIAHRDKINKIQIHDNSKVYIGEPGMGPGSASGAKQYGTGTRVGLPVNNWKDEPDRRFASSRAGDYDYNRGMPTGRYASASQLNRQPAVREIMPEDRFNNMPSLADPSSARSKSYSGAQVNKYNVKGGETLSGISEQRQIYGDWAMWPLIWDANRGVISDPDMIRPQQRLDIPRDYSRAEASDARKRAWGKGVEIRLNDGR